MGLCIFKAKYDNFNSIRSGDVYWSIIFTNDFKDVIKFNKYGFPLPIITDTIPLATTIVEENIEKKRDIFIIN